MMLKKGIVCVLYFFHTVNKRQTGHFPPDNFIFWPWILISEIICTFKMQLKVSLWTWNLSFWESAPKQAQKHLMQNSSGMLHKWDPETLLSCSKHREDTSGGGNTSAGALNCSSNVPDPWYLIPEWWSTTLGCVIRSELRSSFQRQFFVKWRNSPEGHCYFFSLQDGAHKEMETFACYPGQCLKDGQDFRFSSVLSLFYQ